MKLKPGLKRIVGLHSYGRPNNAESSRNNTSPAIFDSTLLRLRIS